MEAKQNSITKFMQQQDAQFFIPVYQRNYDWKIEHCKQLLFDIIRTGTNQNISSHFVGSIVYIQNNPLASSPVLTIIDGQQRLTTLTLIIIALANRASENGDTRLEDELKRRYLINEYMKEDEKLKLKPIKKDSIALKSIINNHKEEFKEYSRLIENYTYFYENIKTDQIDIVKNGIQKLVFIEIGLDKDKDDPQKIFQSLNSTGLDLSQADLIRNYVLMGLPVKSQSNIYENYWIEIESNCTENKTKNNRLSEFIRDFLTFKFSNIPNQDKVFETFKDRFSFNDEAELISVLEEIKSYSRLYNVFINPENENQSEISENLKLIKKLQINVSYPFLLQVFNDYKNKIINLEILIEVLELIQSFVWRRFICGAATNALNKIFMDLHHDIDNDKYLTSLQIALVKKRGSQRFPNNEEVIKELQFKDMYYIQPKNRTYFLERLENFGQRIKISIEGNPDVTIEHILPQNPGKEWKEILGDEFQDMYKYVNTAANLTLSAFNKELSNSNFKRKRDFPDKGYRYSPLRMDKLLADIEDWNLSTLNLRRNWVIKRFLEIWKYPEISVEFENNVDVNILDLDPDDIKNIRIEYFTFFDKRYDNPNFKEFLEVVASKMFEREPHMFIATDLSDKLSLTQNKELLARPLKISQSYFIECNLSGSHIIRRVQLILEKCETDDDLYIKFID